MWLYYKCDVLKCFCISHDFQWKDIYHWLEKIKGFFFFLYIYQNSDNLKGLQTCGLFIQDKWLNLRKDSEVCDVLICIIPVPISQLHRALKTNSFTNTVAMKSGRLAASRWQNEFESPPKFQSWRIALFNLSGHYLKISTHKTICIWTNEELTQWTVFLCSICWNNLAEIN